MISGTPSLSQGSENDNLVKLEFDEIIVSATRTIRQLSSLPLQASLISKTELKQTNRNRLNNILTEQTGLITVQNFIGGEGIQMQGLESEYVLILIDGAPLIGRSAGTLDISRVATGNIKQIEIVKGASSSLYGSDALGGIINIITDRQSKNGFKGDLNYQIGSFRSHDTNVNLGFKKAKYSINTFINRNSSDGYNLNNAIDINTIDPYVNFTAQSKLDYFLGKNTKLYVSTRYFLQNQEYIPTQSEAGKINVNEWNTHLKLNHYYNDKWSSYFEFYATQYKAKEYLNTISNNSLFSQSDYNEFLIRPEVRASYTPNEISSFVGGIGIDHESIRRTDFAIYPTFNSPYAYLQCDLNPNEKLNVILGARFDGHNAYKSQFSPKAAVRFELNEKIAFKASMGYGFKAPDFRQLYFDYLGIAGYTILGYNAVQSRLPEMIANGQINSENDILVPLTNFDGRLNPENSVAYNFGLNFKPTSNIKFDINFYRNVIKDLIDTHLIANKSNGSSVFSYQNINKAYTQGIELNTSWKASNSFNISGGYQLLFARDKDVQEAFINGNAFASSHGSPSFQLNKRDYFGLYNRSRHMANIKLFYSIEKWGLNTNLRGTYRSKYGLFDTNSNSYLDNYDDFVEAYTLWNWAANKTFKKKYTIGLGIDNIFDFKDPPQALNDQIFITNIPGRIIYSKVNIQF